MNTKGRFTPVRIINSHQFKILTAVRIIYTCCCACCNSQRVHICENYQIVRNILIKKNIVQHVRKNIYPLFKKKTMRLPLILKFSPNFSEKNIKTFWYNSHHNSRENFISENYLDVHTSENYKFSLKFSRELWWEFIKFSLVWTCLKRMISAEWEGFRGSNFVRFMFCW